jgi:hypothetical protein
MSSMRRLTLAIFWVVASASTDSGLPDLLCSVTLAQQATAPQKCALLVAVTRQPHAILPKSEIEEACK